MTTLWSNPTQLQPIEPIDMWADQVDEWADHVHNDTLLVYKLEEQLRALSKHIRRLARGIQDAE